MQIPKDIASRVEISDEQDPHIPRVLKINPSIHCEDCGMLCNRNKLISLHDKPIVHWRHKCMNCKFFENPVTGKYDINSVNEYNRVLVAKNNKMINKSE